MPKTKRKGVSTRTRFEVFKRDAFKCQYCGKAAPEVVLHVDHVVAVVDGGSDELLNLITACAGCNLGKADVPLADDSAVAKQRAQLEELALRREQIEMMVKWRQGLSDIDEMAVDQAASAFAELSDGKLTANETGRAELKRLIKKHGLADVLEAIDDSATQYLKYTADGEATDESLRLVFAKIGPVCRGKNMPEDKKQLFYIRGICRNRLDRCVDWECIRLLEDAYAAGASIEYLKKLTFDTERWSIWKRWMREVAVEYRADDDFPGWREDPELANARAKVLGLSAEPGESLEAFVARIDRFVGQMFR